MITSVTGTAEKNSGQIARTSSDEALKRTESVRPAKAPVKSEPKPESAVVEISSEGARRAQQQSQVQNQKVAPAETDAKAQGSVEAQRSDHGPEASAAKSSAAQQGAATTVQQDQASTVKEFDDADTNQDHTVSVLERRAYDFMHPTLKMAGDVESESGQQAQPQPSRAVDAELKAYAEIAKAGRNV
ncbi:hypothetical protein WG899_20570 [Paucibacter sp. AS339]|uniref:hypothetical protein n=1 Tax=Paucibacter hankyongi TaxID=3133434 RepID=UPI00309C5BF7